MSEIDEAMVPENRPQKQGEVLAQVVMNGIESYLELANIPMEDRELIVEYALIEMITRHLGDHPPDRRKEFHEAIETVFETAELEDDLAKG